MLRQTLDSDNSYEGLLHRYRHDLTLDWQWQHYSKTAQGRRTAGWDLRLRLSVMLEDNRFRFTDYVGGKSDQHIHKTYVLPKAHFSLKRKTHEFRHELNFAATLSSSSPSMTSLVSKTFATDPLNVMLGTPDLKQRTDIDLSFSYQSDRWLQRKERQLYGNAG